MIQIVIGNILALIASLIMAYSGFVKEKKKILYIQTVQVGFFLIANMVLGGVTGVINNIINGIQNILCYKDKLRLKEKILITIFSTVFSLAFNNIGVIGLLPLISTVVYIWLMNIKDVIKFKLVIIFTLIMWMIYSFTIKSYTSAFFDLASIISNCISIYQLKRKKQNNIL